MAPSRAQLTRTLVALVFLTSLPITAAVGAAQSGASSGDEFTLDELTRSGTQITNGPPSLRWLGDDHGVYIDYKRTNPLLRGGGEDWQVQQLLRPGSTVKMNELRFHLQGSRSAGNATFDVHLVYWQEGRREFERNGTTVERVVPVNVTHVEKQVSFSGPFDTATIDLRPHYDESYRVTMWIEGYDGARWRFRHHSVATSRTVETTTAGERLWWLLKDFVLWILLFGFIAAGLSLWAIRRAGTGPMIGMFWWAVIIIFVGLISLVINYEGLATMFIRGPKVLAFITVGLLTIPLLEGQEDRLKKIVAIKPVVTEGKLASGETALDSVEFEEEILYVTDTSSGRHIRVSAGPVKFLARLAGGFAEIPRLREKLKTKIDLTGRTGYDSMVIVDHKAEEVAPYESEGFSWTYPETRAGLAWFFGTMGGLGAILLLTMGSGSLWFLGIAALPFVLDVEQGEADLEPAPAHSRPALVSILLMAKEFKEAETVEDATSEMVRERAKTTKDVQEQIELRDDTIVSELLGGDVSATIKQEDVPELEEGSASGGDEE